MKTTFNSVRIHEQSSSNKQRKLRNKGLVTGLLVSSFIDNNKIKASYTLNAINDMKKCCKLDETTFLDVKNSINQGLVKSGLKDKGVKILNLNMESKISSDEIIDSMFPKFFKKVTSIAKSFAKKHGFEQFYNIASSTCKDVIANSFKSGQNAAFGFYTNKIILPDKLVLSGFHEMGHALNRHSSKIFRLFQNIKPIKLLAGPILLISLFNKDKVEDTKNTEGKSTLRNAAGFIKRNAGKLTFAMFLPEILEEGMSSKRGLKIAKDVLKDSPALIRKVKQMNFISFSTYIVGAGLATLGTYLAVKAKDAIQENYEFSLKAKNKK